ncbi:MAG: hypothetical protein P4L49_01570 [Desulfosporosinus sp.]|nr:hypothetical protein [Desulfosporosinus sp.]
MSEIKCHRCGSTQLSAGNKGFGFGLGKAAVGGALLGPIGLLGGMAGKNKVIITCLACGYQWKPGDKSHYVSNVDDPEKYASTVKFNKSAVKLMLIIGFILVASITGYYINENMAYNNDLNSGINLIIKKPTNDFITSFKVDGRILTIYVNDKYQAMNINDKDAKLKSVFDDFSKALVHSEVHVGNLSSPYASLSDKIIVSHDGKEDYFDWSGLKLVDGS